jgi:hypothetical protein
MNQLTLPGAPATRIEPNPTTAKARAAASRMKLSNIVSGPTQKPPRILLYGVDGVGKTTLAACAPAPIFIGTEDGTARLTVPRFPEPTTWLEALAAVDELAADASHGYRTLVIDTLDWLEPLCWAHCCIGKRTKEGTPVESLMDIQWGNGPNVAQLEWRILVSKLEHLRDARGMAIILIAHSWIKTFKNPQGDDFDRYEIKLHPKASGLWREWCDIVLFATHEQYTHQVKGRTKAISTGARIMHTERAAAFDAKNRHGLPPVLPLDWQSLSDAITTGQPAAPAVLCARIEAQLQQAPAALQERVHQAMAAAADDAGELARIANKLSAQLTINAQDSQEEDAQP